MSAGSPRKGLELSLTAELSDVYDGLARILGDAQRFGFSLSGLDLVVDAEGNSLLRFTLGATSGDAAGLVARLRRHPSVVRLEQAAGR